MPGRPLRPIAGDELVRRAGLSHDSDLLNRFTRSRYYPVAIDDLLYVWDFGHGDVPKSARAFARTWDRIPQSDRTGLTGYWGRLADSGYVESLPGVLGIPIYMEANSTFRHQRLLAVCEGSGSALKFYSHVIDALPARHLPALIAHELAHVLQAARGEMKPADNPTEEEARVFGEWATNIAYHNSEGERSADLIAAGWGFNVAAFSRWASEIDWDALPRDRY
jgi:hypothetical protein